MVRKLMSRNTIARAVSFEGIGLHTGEVASLIMRPTTPGAGIGFRRVDGPDEIAIPARIGSVGSTDRRTVLGKPGFGVETVEHLLAAIYAMGIDDIELVIRGREIPIADGSSRVWLDLLSEAGLLEQPGERAQWVITHPFTVSVGGSSYQVFSDPARLTIEAAIEWDHPLIMQQSGSWEISPVAFASELAGARTFGFMNEAAALKERGLVKGASLTSALVLDESGLAAGKLHWPDEFLRHKVIDVIGDLALLGKPVLGRIVASRPSHQGNIELARAITRNAQLTGKPVMDINQISKILPHRYPFLLVDRVIEAEPGHRIVAIKNVSVNEPFFQGHFPGHPIMPGVLIVEAMAQAGGCLLMAELEDCASKVVYFMSMDKVKFRRPVTPGDQLRLVVELLQLRGKTCRMQGSAFVEGRLVAEAEMMARIVDQ